MGPSARRTLWIALALSTARGVLGFIFFMAGVYKVFSLTPSGHVHRFFLPFQDSFLPLWSLWVVGFTIPFVELTAGTLVLLGWRRTLAYGFLGGLLLVVTFGHLLHNPLYPFHEHVIPRLALLLLLLLMPPEADRFSLDEFLGRRGSRGRSLLKPPLPPASLLIVVALALIAEGNAGAQSVQEFRVLQSLPVPSNPHGIAFSPDGAKVYLVSSAGQALTVLDARTHAVIQTFPLTDTPLGIVLTPDGDHAAISHFGADRISRIDLKTGSIDKTLHVGGRPSLFAVVRDGRRAFVSCESADRVYEIDLEGFEVVGSFSTGKRPFPPAVSGDSRWLFVPGYDSGDVTVIDLVGRKVTATVKVGIRPSGGTVLPGDGTYAVTNRGSNSISVVDPATTSVRRTLSAGIEEQPFSVVLSPEGRFGFVNNTAAASVSVLDVQRFAVIARVEVCRQPIVMAAHPSGRTLYVSCEGSHELAVVAIPP